MSRCYQKHNGHTCHNRYIAIPSSKAQVKGHTLLGLTPPLLTANLVIINHDKFHSSMKITTCGYINKRYISIDFATIVIVWNDFYREKTHRSCIYVSAPALDRPRWPSATTLVARLAQKQNIVLMFVKLGMHRYKRKHTYYYCIEIWTQSHKNRIWNIGSDLNENDAATT